MAEISEKNTKKEILQAYADVVLKLERAELDRDGFKRAFAECMNEKETLSVPASDNKVTVVIPFIAEFAQGNELQLALRSWDEHFRENFNVVIIGDRLPWMNDELDVIECTRAGDNPPLDIARKMKMAIESPLVTDKFIWTNDDQYLVSPCMLADFETLKCVGRLDEFPLGTNLYNRNKKRTFDLLKEINAGLWDFSTHTPFVFEKEKLSWLIHNFNLTEEAHLISTLYHNIFFPGFIPYRIDSREALLNDNLKIGVYRSDADFALMKKLLPGKKIVNNSQRGWTPQLEEILNNTFPEKCRFEAV